MNKRLSKLFAIALVSAIMLGAFPIIMPAVRALPTLPAFWVVPNVSFNTNTTAVGTLFNVTLYAGTASDVYAYNWGVLFDTSQLAAVKGGYTGLGGESQWFGSHASSASGPIIDNIAGEVTGGESLLGSDVVPASSGSVVWIEFQIIAAPTPGNTLTSTHRPELVGFVLPRSGSVAHTGGQFRCCDLLLREWVSATASAFGFNRCIFNDDIFGSICAFHIHS